MNWGVKDGYVSGDHFYMNTNTLYKENTHHTIDYTKERDTNIPNESEIEIIASTLHQCSNMECNN